MIYTAIHPSIPFTQTQIYTHTHAHKLTYFQTNNNHQHLFKTVTEMHNPDKEPILNTTAMKNKTDRLNEEV